VALQRVDGDGLFCAFEHRKKSSVPLERGIERWGRGREQRQ
jgi:hypothetical protein